MPKNIISVLLVLLFSVTLSAQKTGKTVENSANEQKALTLDEKIKNEIKNFKGNVWIYAKNLDNGKEYDWRGDERVRTASTIKFPIMVEVFHQIAEGKVKWTDEIVLSKEKKVGGSGVLSEFSDDLKIDLKTATNLMIVISDNTATNVVLDKVTSDAVNERMEKLGLKETKSLRKVGGGGDSKIVDEGVNRLFGIGVSTPREMVKLLEMIERGQVISKESSKQMIDILKRQQYKDGLGRNLLDTIPAATKSGSLDRLRSDVGIIYTRRGRIAMAITVDDMDVVHYSMDDIGNELIWRLSLILQEELGKK